MRNNQASKSPKVVFEQDYFYQPNAFNLKSVNYLQTIIKKNLVDIRLLTSAAATYYFETKDNLMLSLYQYLFKEKAVSYENMIELVKYCSELSDESLSNDSSKTEENDVLMVSLFHYLYQQSVINPTYYNDFLQFAVEPYFHEYLSQLIKRLQTHAMEKLFNDIFLLALNHANQETLILLRQTNPALLASLESKLEARPKEYYKKLKSVSPANAKKISYLIEQFTNGPGNIDEEGAFLMCAYIKQKKAPLPFMPLILKPYELETFFKLLKERSKLYHLNYSQPISQNFIVTGDHWMAGKIEITCHGTVSVLFLDSIGEHQRDEKIDIVDSSSSKASEKKNNNMIKDEDEEYTANLVSITYEHVGTFAKVFSDLDPSNVFIFVPEFKRQYSEKGCSVIALRDLRKLENYERYMKQNVIADCAVLETKTNLIAVNSEEKYFKIRFCGLPLIFMPMAQTKSYIANIEIRPKEELQKKINKIGETALEATSKFFTESSNFMNRSNDYKLKKWAKILSEYLVMFVDQHKRLPNREMREFCLSGFQQTALNDARLTQDAATSSIMSNSILFSTKQAITPKEGHEESDLNPEEMNNDRKPKV